VTTEPQSPPARRVTAASIVPSVIGLALLVSWFVRGGRAWWMLVLGIVAAIGGTAVAARARREPPEESADQRGGR
jgi:hypothetical protein